MTRRQSLAIVLLIAGIAFAFVAAEHAARQVRRCSKCGIVMRPFKEGTDRQDDDILECPQCGDMINLRHTMKGTPQ